MNRILRTAIGCGLAAAPLAYGAAVAAPCSASAGCATLASRTYNLGDLTVDPDNGAVNNTVPKVGSKSTSFTDNYNFSLSSGGSNGQAYYANLVTKLGGKTAGNITDAALKLVDITTGATVLDTTTLVLNSAGQATLALSSLMSGDYLATLTGIANGSGFHLPGKTGTYAGTYAFSITAPTPEPAAWASMMLGFGLLGFVVRWKKGERAQGGLANA